MQTSEWSPREQYDNAELHKIRTHLYSVNDLDDDAHHPNKHWEKHFRRQQEAGVTDDPNMGLVNPVKWLERQRREREEREQAEAHKKQALGLNPDNNNAK